MEKNELRVVRNYLEEGKVILSAEEQQLDVLIEKECNDFFSLYGITNESLKDDYRTSIRNIYKDKIMKKKEVLDDINGKLSEFEEEYMQN